MGKSANHELFQQKKIPRTQNKFKNISCCKNKNKKHENFQLRNFFKCWNERKLRIGHFFHFSNQATKLKINFQINLVSQ